MTYFTNLIYNISIFKILYIIKFTNVLATYNNSTKNENPITRKYEDLTILEQVKDIERPLTIIFPFITTSDGICVKSSRELFSSIDHLNFGECKTVISFELSYNGIETLPEYLKSFKCMKYLNLSYNGIETLPEYLQFFNCIEHLNLCSNGLRSSSLNIISELTTLVTLNLMRNLIIEVSAHISGLRNLKNLYLGGESLNYVANELYDLNLITLEWSYLACAYWTIGYMQKYNTFSLINNSLKIKTLENFTTSYVDLLDFDFDKKTEGEEYYLKRLTLANCNLSELSDSILKFKELEYLDLKNNRFTKVPSILSEFESLKELDLTGNYFIISYENIYFHSLEILHIEWNVNSEGMISINNTCSTHLKYLHINIPTYESNSVRFDSSTIKNLIGLYQYGKYMIKTEKHKNILQNLKFLHIEENCGEDIINIISYLTNLRKLDLSIHSYSSGDFLEDLFSNLKLLKNLENLSLKAHYNNTLLDDKICNLKNFKELHLYKFHIENIECFNKISELKSISFKYTKFRESKDQVNLFLRRNKIKVTYMNCEFNSILDLEVEKEDEEEAENKAENEEDEECWWHLRYKSAQKIPIK